MKRSKLRSPIKQMPVESFFAAVGKRGLGGHSAKCFLVHLADREAGIRQLLLVEHVEEIALVLVAIPALEQAIPGIAAVTAHVVPGRHAFRPEVARVLQKHLELDFAVAQHVRVGCAAGFEFGQKSSKTFSQYSGAKLRA